MSSDAPAPEKTADALVGRLFEQSIGMFDVMSVYVGDRLGLYRSLRDDGPATSVELGQRARIAPRYAREWLEQQAVTGILDVDDASAEADARRYSLPDGHAAPLLDPDSPYSIAPLARSSWRARRRSPSCWRRIGPAVAWSGPTTART